MAPPLFILSLVLAFNVVVLVGSYFRRRFYLLALVPLVPIYAAVGVLVAVLNARRRPISAVRHLFATPRMRRSYRGAV